VRILVLVGLATLALSACTGPTINGSSEMSGASSAFPHTVYPTGPYDNTGRGPQETGLEGGGG
jgi:hypothetical protein